MRDITSEADIALSQYQKRHRKDAEMRERIERLEAENGKYERCLADCAEKLQSAVGIGAVKSIGLLEVPAGIEQLVVELREAILLLKRCYQSGNREGWEPSESVDEVMQDVRMFLDDHVGPEATAESD